MRFHFVKVLLVVACMSAVVAFGSEIVVLTETPVESYTLPDGSVLKNAFVWRRSSAGLMIIHDDGQHFLNYKTLPEAWKNAYLGVLDEPEIVEEPATPAPVISDRYKLESVLNRIPTLNDEAVAWLLSREGGVENRKTALTLALCQSLVSGDKERATRYFLIIEERKHDIDSVQLDKLFTECKPCGGKGEYKQDCLSCDGYGKCAECEGTGLLKEGLGKLGDECPDCEKTGDCPDCEGLKQVERSCSSCLGRGRLLKTRYAEVNRDYLARMVNAAVANEPMSPLPLDSSTRVAAFLKVLPDLYEEAADYYLSDEYKGEMDLQILVSCVMWSLLKDNLEDAERFKLMTDVYFPKNTEIKVEDYLKTCTDCKGEGRNEENCPKCEDGKLKGKCSNCEGSGEAQNDFRKKTECEVCDGRGICPLCKGGGKADLRCTECKGRGIIFSTMRAEVKLELMVGDLIDFYENPPPPPEEEEVAP